MSKLIRVQQESWAVPFFSAGDLTSLLAGSASAQASNFAWENAVKILQQAFTSTIARRQLLVATIDCGQTFAFGKRECKALR
jgi:hypothetical protein